MITWRELRAEINMIDETYLDFPVSVYITSSEEFYDAEHISHSTEDDVLSKGEPYIVLNNS